MSYTYCDSRSENEQTKEKAKKHQLQTSKKKFSFPSAFDRCKLALKM